MSVLEMILLTAFVTFLACIMICMTWWLITFPYFYYHLHKKKNKLQWKCDETWESREHRENHESDIYECSVYYRILPSELNKFVRIFADNDWHNPFHSHRQFKSENDFKEFVKNWKTYGDFERWIDKENGTIWYEPPIDE